MSKANKKTGLTKEDKFRKKVDLMYKFIEIGLTGVVTLGSISCPPIAYLAGLLLVLVAALNYYDKKNDYKVSHWFANKIETISKMFNKIEDQVISTQQICTEQNSLNNKVIAKDVKKVVKKLNKQVVNIENVQGKDLAQVKLSTFKGGLFASKFVKNMPASQEELVSAIKTMRVN